MPEDNAISEQDEFPGDIEDLGGNHTKSGPRSALRTEGHDGLTEQIIAAAIEVHRTLGPGLLVSIYEEALAVELRLRGIAYERQVQADVIYKDRVIQRQRLDLLVEGEVIVETKSVAKLPDVALAQVRSYLKATRLQRGLLLNFGCSRMVDGIKRISL